MVRGIQQDNVRVVVGQLDEFSRSPNVKAKLLQSGEEHLSIYQKGGVRTGHPQNMKLFRACLRPWVIISLHVTTSIVRDVHM